MTARNSLTPPAPLTECTSNKYNGKTRKTNVIQRQTMDSRPFSYYIFLLRVITFLATALYFFYNALSSDVIFQKIYTAKPEFLENELSGKKNSRYR